MNKHTLIFIIIALALIFSLAGLISISIEIDISTGSSANRTKLIILSTVLSLLLFGIIVVYLFPKVILSKNRITNVIRFGSLAGLLLVLTQSVVLYDKLSCVMQSEIVGFAIYNVIELAIGRIIIALLYGTPEYPSLPAKSKR